MELSTFWRLAVRHGWRTEHHFLFYPNPWPKPAHLTRRWHAHPAFPWLLALGGTLEMRCNWDIFAQEFSASLALCGVDAQVDRIGEGEAVSPFEDKYRRSRHTLWRVCADVDGFSLPACLSRLP